MSPSLRWVEMSSTPHITGGQTLFRVGQRGSGQSQLVGEVRLTAQQHLNAVLVGELNITQILMFSAVVPSNRLFSTGRPAFWSAFAVRWPADPLSPLWPAGLAQE